MGCHIQCAERKKPSSPKPNVTIFENEGEQRLKESTVTIPALQRISKEVFQAERTWHQTAIWIHTNNQSASVKVIM